jgi:hypothetical protein
MSDLGQQLDKGSKSVGAGDLEGAHCEVERIGSFPEDVVGVARTG